MTPATPVAPATPLRPGRVFDPVALAASGSPVVCLDTCCILDVVRLRDGVNLNERRQAIELVRRVEAGLVVALVAEQVVAEYADNVGEVVAEAERHLQAHADRVGHVDALVGMSGPAVVTPVAHLSGHVSRTRAWAERLLLASHLVPQGGSIASRAFSRMMAARAPARKGKDSMKDCVVIETCLDAVAALRGEGLAATVAFASSNVRDYREDGAFRPELAVEAAAIGLDYMPNLAAALHATR